MDLNDFIDDPYYAPKRLGSGDEITVHIGGRLVGRGKLVEWNDRGVSWDDEKTGDRCFVSQMADYTVSSGYWDCDF